jgi:fatty acid desaturase (delta-4 desaturase)
MTGFYLSFFFLISHNFKGTHIQEDTTRSSNKDGKKNSYLYKQISSSSNVGGWWLAQLNGGLNYQIEHHLFPRMSHMHYHRISPIVKYVLILKSLVMCCLDVKQKRIRT